MINKLESIILDELKCKSNRPLGVFNGNMGICLALYIKNKYLPSELCEKVADKLLELIENQLEFLDDFSMENGIAGIGWAITNLHKQKCINGDIDDILFQIDATIYKKLNDSRYKIPANYNGLIGFLMYLTDRLSNPLHNTKTILHSLLVSAFRQTIDKLFHLMPKELNAISKDLFPNMIWDFPILFYYIGKALDLDLYNDKINNMIDIWEMQLFTILPYYNINKLELAVSLFSLNQRRNSLTTNNYIDNLIKTTDFSIISEEIDRDIHTFYTGWCNALIILDLSKKFINDKKIICEVETQKSIINQYRITTFEQYISSPGKKDITLVNGLCGLLLAYILFPKAFETPHSLITQ